MENNNNRKKAVNQNRNHCIFNCCCCVGFLIKYWAEWTGFQKIIDTITSAAAPIIVGFVIAFLLNPLLVFFDRLCHTILQDRVIRDKKKIISGFQSDFDYNYNYSFSGSFDRFNPAGCTSGY